MATATATSAGVVRARGGASNAPPGAAGTDTGTGPAQMTQQGVTQQGVTKPTKLAAALPVQAEPADTGPITAIVATVAVWASIVSLPLSLTVAVDHTEIFAKEWYAYDFDSGDTPPPLGLCLGLLAVAVGQLFMLLYHWMHRAGYFGTRPAIQIGGARPYEFREGLVTHLSQPEGFVLLGGYLVGTWMCRIMPPSYYSFDGGIQWGKVALQLLLQDLVQYCMHRIEHVASPALYKISHKPHHRFVNPRLFDAFNGSAADTTLMILVPLAVTAKLVQTNVWSYMAFGALYANWLVLIHSEFPHPWDAAFRRAGLGTAADHHVHHKLFRYNFGHLFMYWDMVGGTYRDPKDCTRVFNKGV